MGFCEDRHESLSWQPSWQRPSAVSPARPAWCNGRSRRGVACHGCAPFTVRGLSVESPSARKSEPCASNSSGRTRCAWRLGFRAELWFASSTAPPAGPRTPRPATLNSCRCPPWSSPRLVGTRTWMAPSWIRSPREFESPWLDKASWTDVPPRTWTSSSETARSSATTSTPRHTRLLAGRKRMSSTVRQSSASPWFAPPSAWTGFFSRPPSSKARVPTVRPSTFSLSASSSIRSWMTPGFAHQHSAERHSRCGERVSGRGWHAAQEQNSRHHRHHYLARLVDAAVADSGAPAVRLTARRLDLVQRHLHRERVPRTYRLQPFQLVEARTPHAGGVGQ